MTIVIALVLVATLCVFVSLVSFGTGYRYGVLSNLKPTKKNLKKPAVPAMGQRWNTRGIGLVKIVGHELFGWTVKAIKYEYKLSNSTYTATLPVSEFLEQSELIEEDDLPLIECKQ